MEIYTILHTCINTKGDHDEANGRVIGVYSEKDMAIKQAAGLKQQRRLM